MKSIKIICPQQQTKQTEGTIAAQPEREYLNLIINNKPLIKCLFGGCLLWRMWNLFKRTSTLSVISPFSLKKKKKERQPRFVKRKLTVFYSWSPLKMASIHNGAGIWLTSSLSDTMAGYPETQPRNGVRYLRAHSKHSLHRRTWRPDWNPLAPLCSLRTVGKQNIL